MRPSASSTLYHPFDEILGTPALVRIGRVLASHGGRLDVSEVAERTRLSMPSVRTALHRLMRLDVVTAIGAGRTMLASLQLDHPLARAMALLFDAERQQADHLMRAIRQAAQGVTPRPVAVWVYGSTARGADRPDSDIDVALVSNARAPSVVAEGFRESLAELNPPRANRVSVVVFSVDEIRRTAKSRTRFWREMERDAVVVLGDSPKSFATSRKRAKEKR